MDFAGYSSYLHHVKLASHLPLRTLPRNMAQKMTINKIQKSNSMKYLQMTYACSHLSGGRFPAPGPPSSEL